LKLKISKANYKEQQRIKKDINHIDAEVIALKEKLHQRRLAFDQEVKTFDKNVALKNASFKREFKHDITGLGTAFKDVFTNNVQ
jgi:hypothetical protein